MILSHLKVLHYKRHESGILIVSKSKEWKFDILLVLILYFPLLLNFLNLFLDFFNCVLFVHNSDSLSQPPCHSLNFLFRHRLKIFVSHSRA